jgi:hypothetical protein
MHRDRRPLVNGSGFRCDVHVKRMGPPPAIDLELVERLMR